MARVAIAFLLLVTLLAGVANRGSAQVMPNIPTGGFTVSLPTTDAGPAPPRTEASRFGHMDFTFMQWFQTFGVPNWRTTNVRSTRTSNAVRDRRAAGAR